MDFWFFPVFLRMTLWRTRLAAASAAFLGNLYCHVILYWPATIRGETAAAWPRRALQVLVVATFFALIPVWNFTGVPVLVSQRLELWRALLGWM